MGDDETGTFVRRTLDRVRPRIVLAALGIAAAAGGCGSSGGTRGGSALFAEDCVACHSLTGRQSPRQQGGDLLALHMTRSEMLEYVMEMPVRRRLSSIQVETVADYVRAVEAGGR